MLGFEVHLLAGQAGGRAVLLAQVFQAHRYIQVRIGFLPAGFVGPVVAFVEAKDDGKIGIIGIKLVEQADAGLAQLRTGAEPVKAGRGNDA